MSRSLKSLAFLVLAAACAPAAHAADRTVMQSFQEAVKNATDAGKLDGSVKFYLAGTGPSGKVLEANVVTNRKTNAFGKSDEKACDWAAQSALISLQEAAKKAGANAVINIVSYYKKNETRDPAKYECHAGAVIAGVALKGDLATVK
ncbi:excinuclease [Bordetella bronchialis]|uniref:Excinuclease n=1 Tax=Bordetella bronchialis TaxID=463025 RepID=A0A193FV75_9BORD|nr:excinuclease [Bordetella bronchialis]ANN66584.1 excinuclease [Bordetella bronchialis]ANN71662.1 excinuclease [Bordetella bronchialis]